MKTLIKFILVFLALICIGGIFYVVKELFLEDERHLSKGHANFKSASLTQILAENVFRPLLLLRIDYYLKESQALQRVYEESFWNKMIKKTDIIIGQGEQVQCGQQVEVKLSYENSTKTKSPNDLEQLSKIYHLGQIGDPLLDNGIIGMRKGGIRILEPPKLSLKDNLVNEIKKVPAISVELISIQSSPPVISKEMLAFSEGFTTNTALLCGDTTEVTYKVKTLTGKIIGAGRTQFKIGANQVPWALELGVIGAQASVKRIIITTAELMQASATKRKIINENIPKDEGLIIEVELH